MSSSDVPSPKRVKVSALEEGGATMDESELKELVVLESNAVALRNAQAPWNVVSEVYSALGCNRLFVGDLRDFVVKGLEKRPVKEPGKVAPYYVRIKSNQYKTVFGGEAFDGFHFGLGFVTCGSVWLPPYGNLESVTLKPREVGKEDEACVHMHFRPLIGSKGSLYEPGSYASFLWLQLKLVQAVFELTINSNGTFGAKEGKGILPLGQGVFFDGEPSIYATRPLFREPTTQELIELMPKAEWCEKNLRTRYIAEEICRDKKKPCVPDDSAWMFCVIEVSPHVYSTMPMHWSEIAEIRPSDTFLPILAPNVGFRKEGGDEWGFKWVIKKVVWFGATPLKTEDLTPTEWLDLGVKAFDGLKKKSLAGWWKIPKVMKSDAAAVASLAEAKTKWQQNYSKLEPLIEMPELELGTVPSDPTATSANNPS